MVAKVKLGKGALPKREAPAPVVGEHTHNPETGELVACNFRVPLEFRTALNTFAASHNMAAVNVMMRAVRELMERVGSDPDAFKN